jgi:pyruvate dehydrogenase E1 component alpha subunit
MVEMREFEELCAEGVKTGEIHGEMHLATGQEASAAGMIGLLRPTDAVVSTHRPHAHALAKGVDARAMLAEIFERSTGLCRGRGGHLHLFDPEQNFSSCSIVGASLPIALGYAYASRLDDSEAVAVAITGDGGSNHGTFHECLNMAGAWRLPFLVVVENNSYAISVPADSVSASETYAERASAYGALGELADGSDVEAVSTVMERAFRHVRSGEGPAIVEVVCARFKGHYEGDIDHYRSRREKAKASASMDPVAVARKRLLESEAATDKQLDAVVAETRERLAALLAEVRSDPAPDAADAGAYVFVDGVSA